METPPTPQEVLKRLDSAITDTAHYVFEKICKWEIAQLSEHNPSFDELASQSRGIAEFVKSAIKDGADQKVFADFQELVEILESVAQSIVDDDNKLLIDCIAHLEQFIEIRGNKR